MRKSLKLHSSKKISVRYLTMSILILVIAFICCFVMFKLDELSATQPPGRPPQLPQTPQKDLPTKPDTKPFIREVPPPPSAQSELLIVDFSANKSPCVVELGEEITLRWEIRGKNISRLKIEIEPDIGEIPLARRDFNGEEFKLDGTKTIKPTRTADYKMRVSGFGGLTGWTKIYTLEKKLPVIVKRPIIENLQPEVDQTNLKISFLVKNSGDGNLQPTTLTVNYQIKGRGSRGPQKILKEGRITQNISIPAGSHVKIGEVNLTDKKEAFSYDELVIFLDTHANYSLPIEKDTDTFIHKWITSELVINDIMIRAFGDFISGSIRLNNYDGSGCCVISHNPYRENDSYVEINNRRHTFSIPRFEFSSGFYDYRGFVNNLTAQIGGREFLSIQDGKLKLFIRFETQGTEIRGWEETWGVWHDLTAPDINITEFTITLAFSFGLRDGRVTYTSVDVTPSVRVEFIGMYEALPERWERYLENEIKSRVRNEIRAILMNDDIRRQFEDGLERLIALASYMYNFTRIVDIKGEGDKIKIIYL